MATYTIQYKKTVAKELKKLSLTDRLQVIKAIQALADEPRPVGVATLQGSKGLFRIRWGDYRIIYEIHVTELLIQVIKVGHRKEVYRDRFLLREEEVVTSVQ